MRVLIIGEINSTKYKVFKQYQKLYPSILINDNIEIDSSDLNDSDLNHDYNKLLFIHKIYDVVIANNILEHIKNLDIFMLNIYKMLKIGGYLIIRTDNALYPLFYIPFRYNKRNYGFYGLGVHNWGYCNLYSVRDKHYHVFTYYHLYNLLKDYNFEIIDKQYGVYKWFINHVKIPILKYFSPRIMVLAKKLK